MYQLIYRSQATVALDTAQLKDLLDESRTYNLRHDVTGLLLYTPDAQFLQVLEGEEQTVRMLYYERIVADPRHQNCFVLSEGPWSHRSFPNWSMGFLAGEQTDVATVPGLMQISRIRLLLLLLAPSHYALSNLLLKFLDRYDEQA